VKKRTSAGNKWTDEQIEWVTQKIEQGVHPARFHDEYCKTFQINRSLGSIRHKLLDLNLKYSHLPLEDLCEYKQVIQQRNEKVAERELKKLQEVRALEERVIEVLDSKVKSVAPVKYVPHKKKSGKMIHESFGSLLSDLHAGDVVDRTIMQGLNEYNLKIMMNRVQSYYESIIEIATQTLSNYQFDEFVQWILGDMVSGRIHEELIETADIDAVEQIMIPAELISGMLLELLKIFKRIKIVCRPGNHGRWSKKKSYKKPQYNWDYMMYRIIQLILKDQDRIVWDVDKAFYAVTEIEGYNFVSFHGDEIKSWMQIPYYGLNRHDNNLSQIFGAQKKFYEYLLLGHFHAHTELPRTVGEIFINGSVKGADEYSFHKLGAAQPPIQKIFGIHSKHGVSWRFPINLS
jgi:hypothetical protein